MAVLTTATAPEEAMDLARPTAMPKAPIMVTAAQAAMEIQAAAEATMTAKAIIREMIIPRCRQWYILSMLVIIRMP